MKNLSFSAEAEGWNCAVESSRGGHSLQRDRMEGQLSIFLSLSILSLGCSLLLRVRTGVCLYLLGRLPRSPSPSSL